MVLFVEIVGCGFGFWHVLVVAECVDEDRVAFCGGFGGGVGCGGGCGGWG